MPQSVLNYIERNRAGLIRSLIETALSASGYKIEALECPEMLAVRRRLEVSILTGIGFAGLQEPPSSLIASKTDVADEPPPPAEAGASPATSVSDSASEETDSDVEVEVHSPPPPFRKKR